MLNNTNSVLDKNQIKCVQCAEPATLRMTWLTSSGSQSGCFCQNCSNKFWSMYKNTPSGQSLIISGLDKS